jgi:prevent-host-death family protein
MKSIGVRELRQRASEYLRLVQQGESVEITDRGTPIALLVPLPAGGTLERLAASGRMEPARADVLELDSPLPAGPGEPLPSEILAELRRSER